MPIKLSAEDATWQLREVADDARWGVREAAWTLEERVIWRGSDAARRALRRALRLLAPLQRLIQTKLAWPLADRLDDYGMATRTAVATVGVAAAIGAGVAGAMLASPGEATEPAVAATGVPVAAIAQTSGPAATLEGVKPDFGPAAPAANTEAGAAHAVKASSPAPADVDADTPPASVATAFAQAFVSYEVGNSDDKTTQAFAATASKPLATALDTDPPRLPKGSKVPEAEVLNVVLGKQEGKEMSASVSLVRLEAASELRLTLMESPKGWRVVEVLG